MTSTTITLRYNHHDMDAIQMGGQMWLRVAQIAYPLGLSSERHARDIFTRNRDEFTPDETRLVSLPTEGGMQEVRVFSLRGTRLLALLARTPEAKTFRRWVLDLLEGRVRRRPMQTELALPGTHTLPKDTLQALSEVAALLTDDHPARAVVQELLDGRRQVSADPALEHLASRLEGARKLHGEANRMYSEIARDSRRIGYSLDAVKAEAKRQRQDAGHA